MSQYVARRILQSLPVLIGITLITFFFLELAPGDATSYLIMRESDAADTTGFDPERVRELAGLNQSAPIRYVRWLTSFLQGNMGRRLITRTDVAEDIWLHVPPTLELMTTSLILSIVLGIPLGVLSALRQYSLFDYVSTAFVFFAVSVPAFFAAMGAIYIFSVQLRWFPSGGYSTPGATFGPVVGVLDRLRYLILPAVVLGLRSTASIMRYTRSSMLDVLDVDYITVARGKGLSERVVILRHALRNALLPVITIIGLSLPRLFGGALIIEIIFNWPGMGVLYMEGVSMRDFPLIMAMTVISATVIVLSNLITDIAYAFADPRIQYQ
jgi:peptide/nickel transport system permease protein